MKDETKKTRTIRDSIETLSIQSRITSEKDKAISGYVLEKAYRIGSALLSLSSLIHSSSEIRHSLDQTALGLIKVVSDTPVRREARGELLSSLRLAHGMLEALSLSGIVSEETSSILIEEMTALSEVVRDTGWVYADTALELPLLHTDLDASMFAPIVHHEVYQTRKEQGRTPVRVGTQGERTHAQRDQERTSFSVKDTSATRYGEKVQDIQKDRRATILGILQRKDRINIKDVSAVIKDCSEKTIQRELLALVAQGVLVKDGERRWSTYRLA
jgi:hypothetical protein